MTTDLTPQDRALAELLAVEQGGVMPLRTAAGGHDVYRQLAAEKLIKPDPASGRYKLTAAGRAQAAAAQGRARAGSVGGSALRGVK